jgi:hypothetical protein
LAIAQIISENNHSLRGFPSQANFASSTHHEETIRKLIKHLADLQEKIRNYHILWTIRGKHPSDSAANFRTVA